MSERMRKREWERSLKIVHFYMVLISHSMLSTFVTHQRILFCLRNRGEMSRSLFVLMNTMHVYYERGSKSDIITLGERLTRKRRRYNRNSVKDRPESWSSTVPLGQSPDGRTSCPSGWLYSGQMSLSTSVYYRNYKRKSSELPCVIERRLNARNSYTKMRNRAELEKWFYIIKTAF